MDDRKVLPVSINHYHKINLAINSVVFSAGFMVVNAGSLDNVGIAILAVSATLASLFISMNTNSEKKERIRDEKRYKRDIFLNGIIIDDETKQNTTDQHVTVSAMVMQSLFPIRISDNIRYSNAVNHYPVSGATIQPIFSFYHTLNFVVFWNTITFFVVFLGFSGLVPKGAHWNFANSALAITGLALLANWLVYLPATIAKINNTVRASKIHKTALVSMDYSAKELLAKAKKGATKDSKDARDQHSIIHGLGIEDLIYDAASVSMRLNDAIAKRYCDPLSKISEIEYLSYILNSFIVDTVREVNNFFKDNKDTQEVAYSYFIAEAYRPLKDKVINFKKAITRLENELSNIERDRDEVIAKRAHSEIAVSDGLMLLIGQDKRQNKLFPEYELLKFGRLENELLAQKIVTDNLPKLDSALEQASSNEQKMRVEQAIVRTKEFVRSIANNTAESVSRNQRLDAEMMSDPLYIDNGLHIGDNIDRMLAIDKRYIDSYDSSLPKTENNIERINHE